MQLAFEIKPDKIHVIAGPGSGKSFLANRLAQILKIEVFDLDRLFWDPNSDSYGVKTPQGQRNDKLQAILKKDKWIIEGVYHKWLYDSFDQADIIVVLNPNPFLRTWRICIRFIKRKLRLIPSKKETIKDLVQLIIWNYKYNSDNLTPAMEFIKEFDNKTVYVNKADNAISLITNTKH